MLKFIKQLFCHHEYETIKVNGFLNVDGWACSCNNNKMQKVWEN